MRKRFLAIGITAVAMLAGGSAFADGDETARLAVLEKENAAMREQSALMRREIEELRQGQKRLERASLAGPTELATAGTSALPGPALAKPSLTRRSALDAYASPAPLPSKAPLAPEARGRLTVWGEGGATFTGGDPSLLFYTPINLSLTGPSPAQAFDLTPKLGWEGAGGFDYRFANSPWHAGGQFRYGEGKAKGLFANSLSTTATGIVNVSSIFDNQFIQADGKERHWLADLTVGKDVLGSGPDAMQD
jgi:hypothetical protein